MVLICVRNSFANHLTGKSHVYIFRIQWETEFHSRTEQTTAEIRRRGSSLQSLFLYFLRSLEESAFSARKVLI